MSFEALGTTLEIWDSQGWAAIAQWLDRATKVSLDLELQAHLANLGVTGGKTVFYNAAAVFLKEYTSSIFCLERIDPDRHIQTINSHLKYAMDA